MYAILQTPVYMSDVANKHNNLLKMQNIACQNLHLHFFGND